VSRSLRLSSTCLLFLLACFVLSGCVTQAYAVGKARVDATQAVADREALAAHQALLSASNATAAKAELVEPDISFTLTTGFVEDKMVFIGTGGEIDGQLNPDLNVPTGAVVEIVLVNGDNVQHNLYVDGFNGVSEDVSQQGQETSLVFTVGDAGVFPYYCTVPGHRQAGMEGSLIVGEGNAAKVAPADLPSIARDPADLPGPLNRSEPATIRVDLETSEVTARLADGSAYTFWTFNGKVPGPFLRVRVGDTVEVYLRNSVDSTMLHSVDLHAVTGPGGGAVATQTQPGGETSFTFKALIPGLFVYHCATPMVAHHITNGMYGLILVEPEGGLPPVDREFYVMQGELYTAEPFGSQGQLTFSQEKLLDEHAEYLVFNGAVGSLTAEHPLQAQVGETVRIFFGVGGPNYTSSFHVIGEIFDRVYETASLTAPPLTDVQTTLVPTGGAVVVEFTLQVPGRYILVDHSLSRLERGLAGFLLAEGPDAPEIFNGEATGGSGH
jgi:nitrite reductase (NO-forming)